MNAYTHAFSHAYARAFATRPHPHRTPLPSGRTVEGTTIADIAKRFRGVHGQRYGRLIAPNEGLDCIGLIERVAEAIGNPLSLDRDWGEHGADLDIPALREIRLDMATPGDILTFDFTQAPRGRRLKHQLAILSYGRSALAPDAQAVCVPHAVDVCWLAPLWGRHLTGAYRFRVREDHR